MPPAPPVHAQQYAFVPVTVAPGPARQAVICTTPSGWVGRKNDPDYWKNVSAYDRASIEGEDSVGVYFWRPDCRFGPECPSLALRTTGLDLGQPSPRPGLDDLLRQLRQHQGSADPDPTVTPLAGFDAGAFGRPVIWQIRSTFALDYLVVALVQRDLLITASLQADDLKAIQRHVASLRELVRSIRIVPATFSTPDIIRISQDQSDAAIRQELLQITPRGTPMAQVAEILDARLMKRPFLDHGKATVMLRTADEIHISLGNNLRSLRRWLQADTKPQAHPSLLDLRAVGLFDRAGKLRKIELRRPEY